MKISKNKRKNPFIGIRKRRQTKILKSALPIENEETWHPHNIINNLHTVTKKRYNTASSHLIYCNNKINSFQIASDINDKNVKDKLNMDVIYDFSIFFDKLYEKSSEFRDIIDANAYIYVHGYLCVECGLIKKLQKKSKNDFMRAISNVKEELCLSMKIRKKRIKKNGYIHSVCIGTPIFIDARRCLLSIPKGTVYIFNEKKPFNKKDKKDFFNDYIDSEGCDKKKKLNDLFGNGNNNSGDTFGAALKRYMRHRKCTAEDLAEALGVSTQTISNYLTMKVNPADGVITAIAVVLSLPGRYSRYLFMLARRYNNQIIKYEIEYKYEFCLDRAVSWKFDECEKWMKENYNESLLKSIQCKKNHKVD